MGESDIETSTQTSSQLSSQPTLSMERPTRDDDNDDESDSDEAPTDFDSDEESDEHRRAQSNIDVDLGVDDLDFLSVSRSASVSYPSIHFGDDDDPQSRRSTRPPSKRQSPVESRALTRENTIEPGSLAQPRVIRTLYIQVGPSLVREKTCGC